MRGISAIVFALSILACNVVYSAPVELNTTDINDLNKIAALREVEMNKHSVQYLETQIDSPVCPAAAMSAAALFARDSTKYKQQFYDAFSVHDYLERAKGHTIVISQEAMLSDIRNIENRYSDEIHDKRVLLLLSYCLYRDQNKWAVINDQRISWARFFRMAFLASIFKGTTIDAVKLAGEIDKRTQMQDLKQ